MYLQWHIAELAKLMTAHLHLHGVSISEHAEHVRTHLHLTLEQTNQVCLRQSISVMKHFHVDDCPCMFQCLSLSIPVCIIKLQRIHVVATGFCILGWVAVESAINYNGKIRDWTVSEQN